MTRYQLDPETPRLGIDARHDLLRREEEIKCLSKIHPSVSEWLCLSKLFELVHKPFREEVIVRSQFSSPLEARKRTVVVERPQIRRDGRRQSLRYYADTELASAHYLW